MSMLPFRAIGELCKSVSKKKNGKLGFALFVFPFSNRPKSRDVGYLSNCYREDVLALLRDFILRSEEKRARRK